MNYLILLLIIPLHLSTHSNYKIVRMQKIEYHEHIRIKLNKILEIPEGRNYWEKKYKTIIYENKLKEYFNKTYGKNNR